jgi:hypothetical protein
LVRPDEAGIGATASELKKLVLQLAGLGLEVPDALGSRTQGADGHAVLGGQRGAVPEAGAARDLLRSAKTSSHLDR